MDIRSAGFDTIQNAQNARIQALASQRGQETAATPLQQPSTRVNISEAGKAAVNTVNAVPTNTRADPLGHADRVQGATFRAQEAVQRYTQNLPAGQSSPSAVRTSA